MLENYMINTVSFKSISTLGDLTKTYNTGLIARDGSIVIQIRQLILSDCHIEINGFKLVKSFKGKHLMAFTHNFKQDTLRTIVHFLPSVQPTAIGK